MIDSNGMEFEDDNPYAQEMPDVKSKKNLQGFSKNLKGLKGGMKWIKKQGSEIIKPKSSRGFEMDTSHFYQNDQLETLKSLPVDYHHPILEKIGYSLEIGDVSQFE